MFSRVCGDTTTLDNCASFYSGAEDGNKEDMLYKEAVKSGGGGVGSQLGGPSAGSDVMVASPRVRCVGSG